MTEDTLSVYILRATKDLFIISIQEPMTLAGVRGFETLGHAYFIEGIFTFTPFTSSSFNPGIETFILLRLSCKGIV